MQKNKNILIVSGEASGDLHASELVSAIKETDPEIAFFGLGGDRSKEAGVNLYHNMVELAVVGFWEVLKNLKKIRRVFDGLLQETDKVKPDLAILIDYPGFNLRLAVQLKKRNIPVVYYISPQIWAWGKKRVHAIKKIVDLMLVVFQFEEELYKENNIPVSFVGHPLLDIVKTKRSKTEFFSGLGFDPAVFTIALLPGSREKEVKNLLAVMLESASLIEKRSKNRLQFLILRAPSVEEGIFKDILNKYDLNTRLVSDMTYDGVASCDFAMVCSGTATLETAILGIPMVILYKVSFLTWAYMKLLIKIPYIGLVNVVKKRKIIPEFIQYGANPKKIADCIVSLMKDPKKLSGLRRELQGIPAQLGEKGASKKAAQEIIRFLKLA
ncbi:MAG: lipid-A-disaccharide synthase [Candidatus Omnitrophica bacterium]|nr:lipid-A-disaccharide synthase [Candidatus Omnitrophota bacterium]